MGTYLENAQSAVHIAHAPSLELPKWERIDDVLLTKTQLSGEQTESMLTMLSGIDSGGLLDNRGIKGALRTGKKLTVDDVGMIHMSVKLHRQIVPLVMVAPREVVDYCMQFGKIYGVSDDDGFGPTIRVNTNGYHISQGNHLMSIRFGDDKEVSHSMRHRILDGGLIDPIYGYALGYSFINPSHPEIIKSLDNFPRRTPDVTFALAGCTLPKYPKYAAIDVYLPPASP